MLALSESMNPVDHFGGHIGIIETDVAIIADVGNGSVIAVLFFQPVPDGGSIAQGTKAEIEYLGNSRNLHNAVLFFLLAVVLFKLVRRQVAVGSDQLTDALGNLCPVHFDYRMRVSYAASLEDDALGIVILPGIIRTAAGVGMTADAIAVFQVFGLFFRAVGSLEVFIDSDFAAFIVIAAAQYKIDFILCDESLSRHINRLRCSVGLERTLQGQQIMLQTLHVVPAASGGILFIRTLQVGLKLDDHTVPLNRVGDQVENLRNLVRETHSAVPDRFNTVHVIAVSIAQPVCHFTAFKEVHHIKVILRHIATSVQ